MKVRWQTNVSSVLELWNVPVVSSADLDSWEPLRSTTQRHKASELVDLRIWVNWGWQQSVGLLLAERKTVEQKMLERERRSLFLFLLWCLSPLFPLCVCVCQLEKMALTIQWNCLDVCQTELLKWWLQMCDLRANRLYKQCSSLMFVDDTWITIIVVDRTVCVQRAASAEVLLALRVWLCSWTSLVNTHTSAKLLWFVHCFRGRWGFQTGRWPFSQTISVVFFFQKHLLQCYSFIKDGLGGAFGTTVMLLIFCRTVVVEDCRIGLSINQKVQGRMVGFDVCKFSIVDDYWSETDVTHNYPA